MLYSTDTTFPYWYRYCYRTCNRHFAFHKESTRTMTRRGNKCFLIVPVIIFVIVGAAFFVLDNPIALAMPGHPLAIIRRVAYYSTNAAMNSSADIITVCQGPRCVGHFERFRSSANAHGFGVYNVEFEGKFTWPKLASAYSQMALSRRSNTSLLIYADSSDVLVQECADELFRRYTAVTSARHHSILVGTEFHCSNKNKCHPLLHQKPSFAMRVRTSEPRYINGGFVMGTAEATAVAWREIAERFHDTQLGWGTYADEHPELVAVDWDQLVVASNTAQEWQQYFRHVPSVGIVHKPSSPVNATTVEATHELLTMRPVFLHVLCHTCTESHPVGKGGPAAYGNISMWVQNSSTRC
jgi:hypothetical protein